MGKSTESEFRVAIVKSYFLSLSLSLPNNRANSKHNVDGPTGTRGLSGPHSSGAWVPRSPGARPAGPQAPPISSADKRVSPPRKEPNNPLHMDVGGEGGL